MPLPNLETSDQIRRQTARDTVFETLRGWIETGVLRPGDRLRDTEIAARLGVSRTPVREALFLLERLDVVEAAPKRRTIVSDVKAADAARIATPLALLHAEAAAEAARLDPSIAGALERVNVQLGRDVRDPGLAEQRRRLDDEFHALIVAAAQNPYLAQVLEILQFHHRRLAVLHFAGAEPSRSSVSEHRAIAAAIAAGTADEAFDLMYAHWSAPPPRPSR